MNGEQTLFHTIWRLTAGNSELWLSGIWQTLWLVGLSLLIGLTIAVLLGIWLAARIHWIWKLPALTFSYIFRGTPMLVQLYIFYFGLGIVIGAIPGIRDLAIWPLLRQAWPWVLLTLVLNTAAYTSEIVRGAIETTPKGEIEAARAMGMNRKQIIRRIVLPGAARRALPAYGNEVIFMLHGSAIVSTATVLDITGVARKIYADTYDPFIPFVTAGVVYLIITGILVATFRTLEKRWNRHL